MTELSKGLGKLVCVLKVKAGEDGKMFGAVTSGMIADELKHQFDVSLDKRKIHLEHPIKTLGEYEVELHLHAEVKGTLKVRVEVENRGLRLRPGMFAQVRIETPASPEAAGAKPIVVPELAVQDLNGKTVVFVPVGAPGRFVARPVLVGLRVGDGFVTISQGLRLGDTVVAKGAFQLRAELLKASFGEDEK